METVAKEKCLGLPDGRVERDELTVDVGGGNGVAVDNGHVPDTGTT